MSNIGNLRGLGTLQFTPDNKHAFAYSGDVPVANGDGNVTVLELSNNSEYLKAKIMYYSGYEPLSTANWYWYTYLNDYRISGNVTREPYHDGGGGPNIQELIIPPFSTIKITGANGEVASDINCSVIMIAEVKGPIEQFNLERIENE